MEPAVPNIRNPRMFLGKEINYSLHLTMMWSEKENRELREVNTITENGLGWEGP